MIFLQLLNCQLIGFCAIFNLSHLSFILYCIENINENIKQKFKNVHAVNMLKNIIFFYFYYIIFLSYRYSGNDFYTIFRISNKNLTTITILIFSIKTFYIYFLIVLIFYNNFSIIFHFIQDFIKLVVNTMF